MKKSKELLEARKKPGLTMIKQVLIKSKSIPGDYHTVKIYEDGSTDCDCVGNRIFKENCGHIKRAKEIV